MRIVVCEAVYGTDSTTGKTRRVDSQSHTGLVRLVAKNGGLREKAMLSGDEVAAAKISAWSGKGTKRKKSSSSSSSRISSPREGAAG